jgi:HlyD family secretion protein
MSVAPNQEEPAAEPQRPDTAAPITAPAPVRNHRLWIGIAVVVAMAAAWAGYHYWTGRAAETTYRTAPVTRGALTAAVMATGTVNPVINVQVGSQVSGQIKELYADFNTEVTKGQLIARIDPDIFETRLAQAEADVAVAKAAVTMQRAALDRAQADRETAQASLTSARAQIVKSQAALVDATRDYDRKRRLAETGAGSLSDRDKAQAAFDQAQAQHGSDEAAALGAESALRSAEAQVKTAQANIETAEAQVALKEAARRTAQVDLDHTYIRAPVDGTVVLRNVDVGQTVAASLQAPVIFTIAQDLRAMQVDSSIDEADVGAIRVGQKVSFTVDAYPGRTFEGEVLQIRKSPVVVQNVVTYDVVVSAPNPELLLLPGLTANVRVVTAQKSGAILVPNAALRYGQAQAAKSATASPSGAPKPEVFVLGAGGTPQPVTVTTGITDGNLTEITEGALEEGQQVVLGEIQPSAKAANSLPGFGGPRM